MNYQWLEAAGMMVPFLGASGVALWAGISEAMPYRESAKKEEKSMQSKSETYRLTAMGIRAAALVFLAGLGTCAYVNRFPSPPNEKDYHEGYSVGMKHCVEEMVKK